MNIKNGHKQYATVVDIRQCAAIPVPLVIEPKTVQWRSERRGQVQSYVNQTELASESNLQRNYFALVERHFSFQEQLKTANMN